MRRLDLSAHPVVDAKGHRDRSREHGVPRENQQADSKLRQHIQRLDQHGQNRPEQYPGQQDQRVEHQAQCERQPGEERKDEPRRPQPRPSSTLRETASPVSGPYRPGWPPVGLASYEELGSLDATAFRVPSVALRRTGPGQHEPRARRRLTWPRGGARHGLRSTEDPATPSETVGPPVRRPPPSSPAGPPRTAAVSHRHSRPPASGRRHVSWAEPVRTTAVPPEISGAASRPRTA